MSEHDAEQRVRQYLDTWDGDASYREPIDKLDGRRLSGADLRDVLRQLDDRSAEVGRLTGALDGTRAVVIERDATIEQLTRERDEARALLGDKLEWTIGHIDIDGTYYAGEYTEAGARHHAAQRRQGEHFPAFRHVGPWQRADSPRVAQETTADNGGDQT